MADDNMDDDADWEEEEEIVDDAEPAAHSFELLATVCIEDSVTTQPPYVLESLWTIWNTSREKYLKTATNHIDFVSTVEMLTPAPPLGFAFVEGGPLRGSTVSWERTPEDIAFSQLKILSMQKVIKDKPELFYNAQTQIILAATKAADALLLAFLLAPKELGGAGIDPAFEPTPDECATLIHAAAITPPLKQDAGLSEEEEGCAEIVEMILEFPATWPSINVPNVHRNNAMVSEAYSRLHNRGLF
jgi:hypothetical protein